MVSYSVLVRVKVLKIWGAYFSLDTVLLWQICSVDYFYKISICTNALHDGIDKRWREILTDVDGLPLYSFNTLRLANKSIEKLRNSIIQ